MCKPANGYQASNNTSGGASRGQWTAAVTLRWDLRVFKQDINGEIRLRHYLRRDSDLYDRTCSTWRGGRVGCELCAWNNGTATYRSAGTVVSLFGYSGCVFVCLYCECRLLYIFTWWSYKIHFLEWGNRVCAWADGAQWSSSFNRHSGLKLSLVNNYFYYFIIFSGLVLAWEHFIYICFNCIMSFYSTVLCVCSVQFCATLRAHSSLLGVFRRRVSYVLTNGLFNFLISLFLRVLY